MKTILLSILILLSISNTAFSQKQNLKMVDAIGKVFDSPKWQGIAEMDIVPLIYAKLEKKYPLVKRNKQVDNTIVELIKLRRAYRNAGDTKKLMYRANDHVIALVLTPNDSQTTRNSKGCEEATEAFFEALGRYDRALKSYSKCVSGSSFSAANQFPIIDSLFGNANRGNTSSASASGGGCKSQLSELRKASSWLSRMINLRNLACKFG